MLTCFLSSAQDAKASIVKFEDRIWITKTGDADVMRRFWVRVEEGSSPLTTISVFLPRKNISNVQSLHKFSDSPDYPFNDYRRFTTPTHIVKGKDDNTIDGVSYKVVSIGENKLNIRQVGEGKSIDLDCSEHPLSPGVTYLIAIRFTAERVVDLDTLKAVGEAFCELYYFSSTETPKMITCIREELVIPIIPLLPPNSGGFVVFMYAPDGHELIATDAGPVQRQSECDCLGNPTKPVRGLLWSLESLTRRDSREPMREHIGFNNRTFDFSIAARAVMRETIYRKDLRRANILAWIAIGIGGASFIAFIVSLILRLSS